MDTDPKIKRAELEHKLDGLEMLARLTRHAGSYDTGFGMIQIPAARRRHEEVEALIAEGRRQLEELQK
jgi:hypothetical protein